MKSGPLKFWGQVVLATSILFLAVGSAVLWLQPGRLYPPERTIDEWQVTVTPDDVDADEVFARLETGQFLEGFVVWREGDDTFVRGGLRLRRDEGKWPRRTTLELSGGEPVPYDLLKRLLELEPVLRDTPLPRELIYHGDTVKYVMFIKRGSRTAKYVASATALHKKGLEWPYSEELHYLGWLYPEQLSGIDGALTWVEAAGSIREQFEKASGRAPGAGPGRAK